MDTRKQDIIIFLEKIAFLYGKSESPHKANAFFTASTIIKETEISDINSITWSSLDGIGSSIELEIETFIVSGTSSRLEYLIKTEGE